MAGGGGRDEEKGGVWRKELRGLDQGPSHARPGIESEPKCPAPCPARALSFEGSERLRAHALATWFSAEGSDLHFIRKCNHRSHRKAPDGLKPTRNTCHVSPFESVS